MKRNWRNWLPLGRYCRYCDTRFRGREHGGQHCSSGCWSNDWRAHLGLEPVPQWTGHDIDPTPAQLCAGRAS